MNYPLKRSALLILFAVTLTAFGCDDSDSNDFDAVYEAELEALNDDNENIASADVDAEMTVDGDQLTITVDAENVESGMLHPQHIHAAGSCPTTEADANADGFVDVVEGVPSYGEIFIGLDNEVGNLESQTSFPNPEDNEYEYSQTVSLSALEAATEGSLDLNGRTVVVHGVSSEVDLPESVATLGEIPANVTLPIACGQITQVD